MILYIKLEKYLLYNKCEKIFFKNASVPCKGFWLFQKTLKNFLKKFEFISNIFFTPHNTLSSI